MKLTKKQKEGLKYVLMHCVGDNRQCPRCAHSFIPEDTAQHDAWKLYKDLFIKKDSCGEK